MLSIEDHKIFLDLISPISNTKIENGNIDIPFSQSKKEIADQLSIKNERIIEFLRISPNKDQIILFKNLDEFRMFTGFKKYKSLLVLNGLETLSFIDDRTFKDFEELTNLYFFTNAEGYLDFIDYLKLMISPDDKEFHFIDSYNFDSRRITMINFSEKGRLNISYPLGIPDFDSSKDYRPGLNAFKNCFSIDNKSFPKFLKSEVIRRGQGIDESVRLKVIFESLNSIVEKANINFEVFLNEVSVEKLKKDYDELKTKYFKELSETLGKITQKTVALPIGVSASLIAIDRVRDSSQFLYLLLAVIVSSSLILSILINSSLKDLNYLKKIFLLDYRILSENKFFVKYSKELELFDEIKKSFLSKISFYFNLSRCLYLGMNISNIFLTLFIFQALGTNEIAIWFLIGVFFFIGLYYLIWKMEKVT